ncbi:GNAT family N-acetyltransferase [Schaalia vaccimaxillae]|uniref:GNAT family N-acetyltransferase n=1 Tax=Schaalia vaccimaxillae TaxID=183916 RepID=UPI0003B724F7|nr:GNAT family N-acetyltransferase [Schaalia vaccimaxillae]
MTTPASPSLICRPVPSFGSTSQQVRDLYKRAFPPSEQVPLPLLRLNALRPSCDFLAWFDPAEPDKVAGLTYSMATDNLAYLAFLAVDDTRRSRGYGSRILDAFGERYDDHTQVLEIEPVEEGFDNYEQRVRRLAFYKRNGFQETNLESHEAKERYCVLTRNGQASQDQLQRALDRFGLWIVRSQVVTVD